MNAFLEYLKDHCYDAFHAKILHFVIAHHDLVEEKFSGKRIGYKTVEDLDFKQVWIDDTDEETISFDVLICPEIYGQVKLGHGDFETQSINNLWLVCSCTAKIGTKLFGLKIGSAEEYTTKFKSSKPLSGDLVPYIPKEDYSKYADEILAKYYPEALRTPQAIDVWKLASNMGLNVIDRRIDKRRAIFGQFFFAKGLGKFYDDEKDEYFEEEVPANTIVVDRTANYIFSYGSENMTIAHECVHAYLHRKAFNFAKMINNSLSCITCEKTGGIRGGENSRTLQWIEWQANSIAPYLLTPSKPFERKVDEVYRERLTFEDFDPLIDTTQVVSDIADYFGITKQAARKRIIDIGNEDAIGCLNWIDDRYVRSYLFKKGSLKKNETYAVSFKDAYASSNTNVQVLEGILCGVLAFAENHVVIFDKKYVENGEGSLRLTEYARRHMDECAVKYSVSARGKAFNFDGFGTACYLCKQVGLGIQFDVRVSDGTNIMDSPQGKAAMASVKNDIDELSKLMVGCKLPEILTKFRDYREMQNKELAIDSDLEERTVQRYLNGENKVPDKRTLIALCIGLDVRYPVIIAKLFREAGIAFKENDEDDNALSMVLMSMPGHDIHCVNKTLINLGCEPLTKKKL